MPGKKLPRAQDPDRQKTTIWLDRNLWKQAKIMAIQQGIDLQDLLANALFLYLQKPPEVVYNLPRAVLEPKPSKRMPRKSS